MAFGKAVGKRGIPRSMQGPQAALPLASQSAPVAAPRRVRSTIFGDLAHAGPDGLVPSCIVIQFACVECWVHWFPDGVVIVVKECDAHRAGW